MATMEALQKQMNNESETIKGVREKKAALVSQRHQLFSQVTENDLVRKELLQLEPDATVYKLIGPVLVSQDLSDANAVVEKRLEYLNAEVLRVDRNIKDHDAKEDTIENKMLEIQRQAQELSKRMQAAAGGQK